MVRLEIFIFHCLQPLSDIFFPFLKGGILQQPLWHILKNATSVGPTKIKAEKLKVI